MKQAYFLEYPRVLEDLVTPHPADQEIPYEIVKQVTLSTIDYENFITDMIADRQFIEDAAPFCEAAKVMKCLLVRGRGRSDGILIVPRDQRHVHWAAYIAPSP